VTSSKRWALMHELRDAAEPSLEQHLARMAPCDLVLIEGFKREPIPKLEIHRNATASPFCFPTIRISLRLPAMRRQTFLCRASI